ncbi:hepatitis A virus cellular receptor 1-like [Pecten maximus]|uniref:hepatitis A virus cellular receptor 1-like n=1 Tax=Pecten maximus TaxID=6579 RepID=UPI0014585501|nr:hepatitis A virus cellular receptor 1-like [Pecten maximus]
MPTTTTTTMPTTTTTTMPTTTTTTMPTTSTTTMATSPAAKRKGTEIPDVMITKSSTKIEIGTTTQGTDRRANVDNRYDALVDRQEDNDGSSTGTYIAIGASSCGVMSLVAAILALVLRRRKRQLSAEASNRTTNTRENPIYDIMHGDGGVPENSYA